MKRTRASFRSGSSVKLPEGEQGFWPSYTDMMSSVALILFFLMLICYIQNLITGKRLATTSTELADTKSTLATTLVEIETAQQQLDAISAQLSDAENAIALQNAQISEKNALLDDLNLTLDSQQTMIAEQKAYIALTTDELTKLRSQMQTIAFLRLEVLNRIKTSIGDSLGDASKVSIGDNGSLILNEGLLFDFGSSTVKAGSFTMLNNLSNAFVDFLSNAENARYVDSIVISGHTDNRGSAESNRTLSTERANAVLKYLFSANNGYLQQYSPYFCGAGYGADRPVASNDTDEGRNANRRIEVSIILKDESVLEIVDTYLQSEIPVGSD